MTQQIRQELADLGFQQDRAKKGVVTWIFATLAVLLFISVGWNMYLVRQQGETETIHRQELKEVNAEYKKVLLELLEKAAKIENKVDTIIK